MAPGISPSDYLTLFRHLPGNYLLLAPDADFTILDNSDGHVAVSLKSRADIVGRPLFEAFPPSDKHNYLILQHSLAYVRQHQQTHIMPLIRYDLERTTEQGGGLQELYWQATHYPILNEQGELHFILQQTEDVTSQHLAEQQRRQTEHELAESQNQARFLLEALPIMLWTTNADGSGDYQNPRWLEFTGRQLEDIAGRSWLEDMHPDDRVRAQEVWDKAQASGSLYEVEYQLRRHDGQYRWMLSRGIPRRNETGEIVAWVGTGTDIQELKQVQQQLAAKDRQLRQILQQIPAHIATLSGPEHIYTFMNERSEQLFGGAVELGVPAAVARPEFVTNGYLHLIDEVYRTAKPFLLSEMPMAQPPAPNGSVSTLYFDGTLQPLTDEQGQTQGILVFGIDVTERVVARQRTAELMEEIRQQDAQFRTLVESLPLFIFITDAEGNVLYFNPQRQAYTGQPSSTDNWEDAIHPDDVLRMREIFAEGRRTTSPWSGEFRLRRHDGQYRWHLKQAVPLLQPDGTVERWYGSTIDIHDAKLFQQQLEAKDQQLMLILSQVPAYIATVAGPEHRFTFATPNYQALMSGRVQLGQPAADLLPEVAAQGFVELLNTVYRTKQPYLGHETPLQVLDASTGGQRNYYLNFVYQPLYDTEGQAQGVLCFGVDVTEQVLGRQRAETLTAEVRRSDERLRRMTEALPNMTFINEAAGVGHYVSPQWYTYTGLAEGSSIANHWRSVVHPEDIVRVEAAYQRARHKACGWSFEVRFRRYDGSYRWFLNKAQPELDAQGQLLRWYGSNTDIHEQKELTEALRQSEEYFRFLSESVPQIIWTAEADGQVDYFNERLFEVTGLRPADCLGPSAWANILHPDDQQRSLAIWQAAASTGSQYEIEYRFASRTGGYRWFLGRAEPLRNEEGEVLRWFGSCTDIDDVKQTQQLMQQQNTQLTQINQALDNFVYTASHDLKQPITNMAGIFEELKRTATFHDEAATELVGMFEGALQQINTTIRDLSDVVQVQRQQELLPLEQIQLLPFTQEIVHSLQDQMEELHARIELDFAASPTLLFVRPNLQSILYNLLSNALKYAAPERVPVIRVATAWPDEQTLLLTVQDNGLGIDLERHGPQLFQLFRRFHHHVPGSGMGLYLVNRLVQQMGGRLELESEVDKGTLFRLFLPVSKP
ncbi:PAS domain S-box-containing protein [Hymenobacter gelipurpurascens]|uniref:histidine kinase n=1 Tax=Hymenobacter gelipurpurascens TaxID=89968 RepID=A0A212UGK8_9BACT|nr:PAS domain S-box protein [Hymenobacter gelipurpurascens]SNC77291.1 PAS domain S-box-containing protein [Hymenobacter gelipurpurascens]